jgi:hypothetical protein
MSTIDRRGLLRVMLGGGAAAATVGFTAVMSPAAAVPLGPVETLSTMGSTPVEGVVKTAAVVVTRPRPRRRVRRRVCFWRAGRRVCTWRWVWI